MIKKIRQLFWSTKKPMEMIITYNDGNKLTGWYIDDHRFQRQWDEIEAWFAKKDGSQLFLTLLQITLNRSDVKSIEITQQTPTLLKRKYYVTYS